MQYTSTIHLSFGEYRIPYEITLSCNAKALRLTVSFFNVLLFIPLPPPTSTWVIPVVLRFCSVELETESEDARMVCVTEFDSPTNILLTSTPLIFSTLKNYPNKFGVPLNVQKHTFQIENENHNFKYHKQRINIKGWQFSRDIY